MTSQLVIFRFFLLIFFFFFFFGGGGGGHFQSFFSSPDPKSEFFCGKSTNKKKSALNIEISIKGAKMIHILGVRPAS